MDVDEILDVFQTEFEASKLVTQPGKLLEEFLGRLCWSSQGFLQYICDKLDKLFADTRLEHLFRVDFDYTNQVALHIEDTLSKN
jgi:hypothetical protein